MTTQETKTLAGRLASGLKGLRDSFMPPAEKPYLRPAMADNPVYKIICDAGLPQTGKADAVRAHLLSSPTGERDFDALLVNLGDMQINLDGENLRQSGGLGLMSQSVQLRINIAQEFRDKEPDALYAKAEELLAETAEIIAGYDSANKQRPILIGKYGHIADVYGTLADAATDGETGAALKERSLGIAKQVASMNDMLESDRQQAVELEGVRLTLALMQQKWREKEQCRAFAENLAETGLTTQRKVTALKKARFGAKQPVN